MEAEELLNAEESTKQVLSSTARDGILTSIHRWCGILAACKSMYGRPGAELVGPGGKQQRVGANLRSKISTKQRIEKIRPEKRKLKSSFSRRATSIHAPPVFGETGYCRGDPRKYYLNIHAKKFHGTRRLMRSTATTS